jgi:CHAD domain-containing protein
LHKAERGDVKAVHQARVASRRLRELLPILELDPAVSRKLGKRLRKVTRALGPVRESDVLLGLARGWDDAAPRERRAFARVSDAVQNERNHTKAQEATRTASKALARAARKLDRASRHLGAIDDTNARRRAWQWALEARVARRALAFDEAVKEAGAVYLPERLHRVRVALKKLRYAVELLVESRGGANGGLNVLKRAQDTLGLLHDLEMMIARARGVQSKLDANERTARKDLDALVDLLERRCRSVHARYLGMRDSLVNVSEQFSETARAPRAARRRAG